MASAAPITDHDAIRRWAEERGAKPARVKQTGGRGDIGMIRLDFPGYSGADSLQPISWNQWFRQFDENELALLIQDRTSRGQKSNFNKLISRQAARAGSGRTASRNAASETRQASPTSKSRPSTARKNKPASSTRTKAKTGTATGSRSRERSGSSRSRSRAR